uniref:BRCT domain-containing protein n=2 Tax=Emiliania huxleyi TaxID=2903 RepID=A0A7S3SFK0_EMIHU
MAPEIKALRQLFGSCVLYCGRECPLRSLEFVVLACGGTLGWDGEASRLEGSDGSITHQIVDRPMAEEDMLPKTREFVQPQWVYDCINARALLPTAPYRPGRLCPPHLSPFLDGDEGYTPLERVRAALTASGGAGEAEGEGGGGEDCSEGGGEESDEESEESAKPE